MAERCCSTRFRIGLTRISQAGRFDLPSGSTEVGEGKNKANAAYINAAKLSELLRPDICFPIIGASLCKPFVGRSM